MTMLMAVLLASAIQLPPSLELYMDGRMAAATGEWGDALLAFQEALSSNPENLELKVAYAEILSKVGLPASQILLKDEGKLDWYGKAVLGQVLLSEYQSGTGDQLEHAIKLLEEAADARPDDAEVWVSLAQALMAAGRWGDAEKRLSELRERLPSNPYLALLHGTCLNRLGSHKKASTVLMLCADNEYLADNCRSELLDALNFSGRPLAAAILLSRWLRSDGWGDPKEAARFYIDAGKPEKALEIIKATRGASGSESEDSEIVFLEAYACWEGGDAGKAVRLLRSLVSSSGSTGAAATKVLALLAKALASSGDRAGMDKVITSLESRLSEDQLAILRAQCMLILGEHSRAVANLEQLQEPEKFMPGLVSAVVAAYIGAGKPLEGVSYLERVSDDLTNVAWSSDRLILLLGRCRLLAAADLEDEALNAVRSELQGLQPEQVALLVEALPTSGLGCAFLSRVVAMVMRDYGNNGVVLGAIGMSMDRCGEHAFAKQVFEKALSFNPKDANAANYLAYTSALEGVNCKAALELAEIAVAEEPDNAAYLDTLAWVYRCMKRPWRAVALLRKARKLAPEEGTIAAHLGVVLSELGFCEEAMPLLHEALELGCDDKETALAALRTCSSAGSR